MQRKESVKQTWTGRCPTLGLPLNSSDLSRVESSFPESDIAGHVLGKDSGSFRRCDTASFDGFPRIPSHRKFALPLLM